MYQFSLVYYGAIVAASYSVTSIIIDVLNKSLDVFKNCTSTKEKLYILSQACFIR